MEELYHLYGRISRAAGTKFWFHGLRNAFISVAERELMLPRSLTKRLVNHARHTDVTEDYAADWTIRQLREPAQRIADRIEELMYAEVSEDAEWGGETPRGVVGRPVTGGGTGRAARAPRSRPWRRARIRRLAHVTAPRSPRPGFGTADRSGSAVPTEWIESSRSLGSVPSGYPGIGDGDSRTGEIPHVTGDQDGAA